MNTDEQDDLWRLLAKAKTPAVSPFFSRNVLRAIREQAPEKRSLAAWFRHGWRIAALGGCALFVAALAVLQTRQPAESPESVVLLAQQFSASPDYQVVSHLDELLDSEKDSVWLEN
jgi:anti-sigma-K factor RskA